MDPCYYYKWNESIFSQVTLYVDDFQIGSDDDQEIDKFIEKMRASFPIKIMPASTYLGMNVTEDEAEGTMFLSQRKYIDNMLEMYGMENCKPVSTPAAPNTKLVRSSPGSVDEEAAAFPYNSAVGALLWVARCSRPDILYAVGQVSQHLQNPNMTHVRAVKHILRYLKGTRDLGLTLRKGTETIVLEAYSDADFAGEPQENEHPMHSLSGIVLYLKGIGQFYSQSSIQKTISRSTSEAEYRAAGQASTIVSAHRNFLAEIGMTQVEPTTIWEDNQSCIAMTKSVICSSKARHIKLDHHYIRQQVKDKEVELKFCPTSEMIADILTKALPKDRFLYLRAKLLGGIDKQLEK